MEVSNQTIWAKPSTSDPNRQASTAEKPGKRRCKERVVPWVVRFRRSREMGLTSGAAGAGNQSLGDRATAETPLRGD
jgi:hypothetical protein